MDDKLKPKLDYKYGILKLCDDLDGATRYLTYAIYDDESKAVPTLHDSIDFILRDKSDGEPLGVSIEEWGNAAGARGKPVKEHRMRDALASFTRAEAKLENNLRLAQIARTKLELVKQGQPSLAIDEMIRQEWPKIYSQTDASDILKSSGWNQARGALPLLLGLSETAEQFLKPISLLSLIENHALWLPPAIAAAQRYFVELSTISEKPKKPLFHKRTRGNILFIYPELVAPDYFLEKHLAENPS
ncbi:hypothetical protein [Aliagarivorans taiwanensis]|uniref:hypothetical protein n=1 Tax=Aliagarivorans taiwanensis TaxID=561966 RepID=UPI000478B933|nr:hypothetical protein [Aliagarivorans taiwanensis]